MKNKVLIFGGTTEGRELSKILSKAGIPHTVSVATKYGADIEKSIGESEVLVGRKTSKEMEDIITEGSYTDVVDATHPFATFVSDEIRQACERKGVRYLRLSRDTGDDTGDENVFYVDSISGACEILNKTGGNILLLTGSKDLKEIAGHINDTDSLYVRVLPSAGSIEKCEEAGLFGKHIIAMQGPFSVSMNIALIKEIGAKAILTKESGKTGGFYEKLEAARICGIKSVVLSNPENRSNDGKKYTMAEILGFLGVSEEIEMADSDRDSQKKHITLAGIGPGDSKFHTAECDRELSKADVIFGAKSVVERLDDAEKPIFTMYTGDDIFETLKCNPDFRNPLVAFSGDISLCSGAKKVAKFFRQKGYEVKFISGISSVTVFAQLLGISLEDVRIISSHGRKCNVTGYAESENKLIVLTSSAAETADICRKIIGLRKYGRGEFIVKTGYELGSSKERIIDICGSDSNTDSSEETAIEELSGLTGKCLMYIENTGALQRGIGVTDDELIRAKIPMTKEEIRALSVRKLELNPCSVLYDIGAGTGSVSIEASKLSPDIEIYSIEKKEDAVKLLHENKDKFLSDNMHIVLGEAPDAIRGLPAPTHVFIGGSGGNMAKIIAVVRSMNEKVRIVINCITPETLGDIMNAANEFGYKDPEIIQINVSRYRKAGNYHLPDALSPVYIVTLS